MCYGWDRFESALQRPQRRMVNYMKQKIKKKELNQNLLQPEFNLSIIWTLNRENK